MVKIRLCVVMVGLIMVMVSHRCDVIGDVPTIEIEDIQRIARHKDSPSLLVFADVIDRVSERLLIEVKNGVHIVNEGRNEKEGVKYYLLARKFSQEEKKRLAITNLPALKLYDEGKTIEFTGRQYAKQISAFLIRHFQQKKKTESAVLKGLEHFEAMEEQDEVFVVYCGKEDSVEFREYQKMAFDKKFLYYHTFEDDFCTRLHIKQNNKESSLFYQPINETEETNSEGNLSGQETKDNQMLNETIWQEHELNRPVIYIRYKKNNLFEIVEFDSSKSLKELKTEVEKASISNFYTDFDLAYDYLYDTSYKNEWYILFSPKNQSKSESPCDEMFKLSTELKLLERSARFGCMSREELPKYGLEIFDQNKNGHTLFFFSYFDMFSNNQGRISRPYKYQLDNPLKHDFKKFFYEVKEGKHQRYFINEREAKQDANDPVKYLIRSNYEEWIRSTTTNKNAVVFLNFKRMAHEKYNEKLIEFYNEHSDIISIGEIDGNLNELDEIVEDHDEDVCALLYLRGSDLKKPKKILNPNKIETFKSVLGGYIPELADLTKKGQKRGNEKTKSAEEKNKIENGNANPDIDL